MKELIKKLIDTGLTDEQMLIIQQMSKQLSTINGLLEVLGLAIKRQKED